MIKIGANLKKLRKQKGLSYRKLAAQVGISHNNLATYEKEEVTPSFENAIRLCKFFEVPLEYLILGDKADFKYQDLELAELTAQTDKIEPELRGLVKSYIQRILLHSDERKKLTEQAKTSPLTGNSNSEASSKKK